MIRRVSRVLAFANAAAGYVQRFDCLESLGLAAPDSLSSAGKSWARDSPRTRELMRYDTTVAPLDRLPVALSCRDAVSSPLYPGPVSAVPAGSPLCFPSGFLSSFSSLLFPRIFLISALCVFAQRPYICPAV